MRMKMNTARKRFHPRCVAQLLCAAVLTLAAPTMLASEKDMKEKEEDGKVIHTTSPSASSIAEHLAELLARAEQPPISSLSGLGKALPSQEVTVAPHPEDLADGAATTLTSASSGFGNAPPRKEFAVTRRAAGSLGSAEATPISPLSPARDSSLGQEIAVARHAEKSLAGAEVSATSSPSGAREVLLGPKVTVAGARWTLSHSSSLEGTFSLVGNASDPAHSATALHVRLGNSEAQTLKSQQVAFWMCESFGGEANLMINTDGGETLFDAQFKCGDTLYLKSGSSP